MEDSGGVYAHIVGNGTDNSRSNAHTLDWSGNAWFAGDVYVGSTSGTNKDDGSVKLATVDEVVPAPATASVGQVIAVKAVDEDGRPTEWEAVDVKPKTWEKIGEIVVGEDELEAWYNFQITEDLDGEPFSLSAVRMVFNGNITTLGYMVLSFNGKPGFGNLQTWTNSGTRCFEYNVINGEVCLTFTSANSTIIHSTALSGDGGKAYNYIEKVGFSCSQALNGSGGIFTVYGIRA